MKKMTLTFAAVLCAGSAYAASVQVSEPGLVSYTIVDDMAINEPLTDTVGDVVNGRKLAVNRKKGNCLACHVMPISEQSFHGETAPSLYGVGNRLSEGELRLQLVNSKVTNENTMMPSFYRVTGYNRILKKFDGKTILSAQEVEDIVAYLKTLTEEQ